jgi:hypothetical protein
MSIKSLLSMCVMYLLTSGLVLAQTAPAEIYVFPDGTCGMFDEFGTGPVWGDQTNISANSANGNLTMICSVKMVERPQIKRSKIWNYDNTNEGLCSTQNGDETIFTDDWHEVITPSGNVKLTCHFR